MSQSEIGPDLVEIETEALGFQSLAGETKLRLFPSWPPDTLPPPTASLLSIASKKGLIAAAGPESVVVASTESVRQALLSAGPAEGEVKSFAPQLTLNTGVRFSHVAFSADESYLVISAQNGAGLAVYNVASLLRGSTEVEFEQTTYGCPLRALVPNPTPEKAELFALVTTDGKLMMANLKTRQFQNSSQGQIFKDGVSCVSWSTRGKQLVAGLGNGTCLQITPEGEAKAEIPRPSDLEGDQHVTAISWLENNLFVVAHASSSSDSSSKFLTQFHLITRHTQPPNTFTFQKFPEMYYSETKRLPPYCTMQRLRDFPPDLQDLIIVVSTASPDVGLFTRSKAALAKDLPAEKITNVFTSTIIANEPWRATLPFSEDSSEASSVGVALDLSSKEKVKRPLPGEDMDESPRPVPSLVVLNEDGFLLVWWLVYADSVRQNTVYPGLAYAETQRQSTAPFESKASPQTSSMSKALLGGNPVASAFSPVSAPGQGLANAFGTSSSLGKAQSPWASAVSGDASSFSNAPSFGKSAFGSSPVDAATSHGVGFGMVGGMVNRQSPWATQSSSATGTAGATFGQPSGLGMGNGSGFRTDAPGPTSGFTAPIMNTGGFASFAKAPGFAVAAAQTGGESMFPKSAPGALLGSGMDTDTSFNRLERKSGDGSRDLSKSGDFVLGSTFKGDGTAANDIPNSTGTTSQSLFNGDFTKILGETQEHAPIPETRETTMGDSTGEGDERPEETQTERESMISVAKPSSPKSQFSTAPPHSGGLLGAQAQSQVTPAKVQSSTPSSSSKPQFSIAPPQSGGFFGTQAQVQVTPAEVQSSIPSSSIGKSPPTTTTPNETPRKLTEISSSTTDTPPSPSAKVKSEDNERVILDNTPKSVSEVPLPPEATSKVSYAIGDSSSSSKSSADDAPLPPDFLPSKSKLKDLQSAAEEAPILPADDNDSGLVDGGDDNDNDDDGDDNGGDDSGRGDDGDDDGGSGDDEGSGVDVAQEISPTTDPNQSPKITPGSSFGASFDRSPVGGMFTKVSQRQPQQSGKVLFGEVNSTHVPYLPPPIKVQESPRSPSPVRLSIADAVFRPDNARSVSLPGPPLRTAVDRRSVVSRGNKQLPSKPILDEQGKKERDPFTSSRIQKSLEEEQDLSDREDEKVRKELATEVQPTLTLEPFLAHQDYIGSVSKPGVPGQIEMVYRDINSMVDTLGLNARSLEAFIRGQTELYPEGGRSREDLETPNWCLFELEDLGIIESRLLEQLEQSRVTAVREKLNICREMRRQLHKTRSKRQDITKIIDAKSDQTEMDSLRSAPLDPAQSVMQHDLRRDFQQFQRRLWEAEEAITVLRAKLASYESNNGKSTTLKKPTVEAVTNTIRKMTSMVEKRTLDINVLETHMRHLGLSSPHNPPTISSREGSPFAASSPSPAKSLSALRNSGGFMQRSFAISSSSSNSNGVRRLNGSSLRTSLGASDTPRKRMTALTPHEVERYTAKARHKAHVSATIKKVFLDSEPRIRTLD